jgi:hypothetical protein
MEEKEKATASKGKKGGKGKRTTKKNEDEEHADATKNKGRKEDKGKRKADDVGEKTNKKVKKGKSVDTTGKTKAPQEADTGLASKEGSERGNKSGEKEKKSKRKLLPVCSSSITALKC